jgi:hypothetical protein
MLGIALKVFRDRDMPLGDGIPVALLFAVWGYLQVRVTMHYDAELQRLTWLVMLAVWILLGRNFKPRVGRELSRRRAQ